jgi:pimeloyl-ACP methyl ester carboxylesterase
MLRVARFLDSFARHPGGAAEQREVILAAGATGVPATYIRPPAARPLPGWIVLHGVTVPGRHHPLLLRFAHALARSGAAVLIPDVPAWRELRLDVAEGDRAILAAAEHLRERPDVADRRLNLVGFSFGATQALASATLPGVRESVGAVLGFGGYCDLGRTLQCMMTGEHEWGGVNHRLAPDPYGRWIAVANYLRGIPEYAHMEELTTEARALAVESGRRGIYAADPCYDSLKREARERLPAEQRELWDLIAPPSTVVPPVEPGRELGRRLLDAALERDRGIDPRQRLASVTQRVVLAHGFDDRLIPYTESLRLLEALTSATEASLTVTRLFAHSSEADPLGYLQYPREMTRYLALLNRALRPCG